MIQAITGLMPTQGEVSAPRLIQGGVADKATGMTAQAAILADRILEGEIRAKLSEVQNPAGTILTVNVKTAAAIGLAIDELVLDLADEVVGAEDDEG